jgi:hypothetical protein
VLKGVVGALLDGQRAVIVAMVPVLVVQVAGNQVIGMVAVRDGLLALMVTAAGDGRTLRRVGGAHRDGVLVVVALVLRMQVTFVQVVGVPFVAHTLVAALVAVNVWMGVVGLVAHMLPSSSARFIGVLSGGTRTRKE